MVERKTAEHRIITLAASGGGQRPNASPMTTALILTGRTASSADT